MVQDDDTSPRKYIPCRVERAGLGVDWETSWRLARLPGLGSGHTSFLFKLLHQILPTQERVARTSPAANSYCTDSRCSGDTTEDIQHSLVLCRGNSGVGLKIVETAQALVPGVTAEQLLRLEVKIEVDDELALVWWVAAGWLAIWELRSAGKRVELYLVRAQLEAKVNLLRTTRFARTVPILEGLLMGLS